MKRILVFKGGVAVVNQNSQHSLSISGQEPLKEEEATAENLKKYFTPSELKTDKVEKK